MTLIHADLEGDAWFPEFDTRQWHEEKRLDHEADEKNIHPYSFVVLDRSK